MFNNSIYFIIILFITYSIGCSTNSDKADGENTTAILSNKQDLNKVGYEIYKNTELQALDSRWSPCSAGHVDLQVNEVL
jgi:hypothetical protein